MRPVTEPISLGCNGVLIERPCRWCDTTSIHFDGLCQDGPCTVCGIAKRRDGWATHPCNPDGTWQTFPDTSQHDWTAHHYEPAMVEGDLPAFEAITAAALKLGWPTRYTSDLFRDYQFIRDNEPDIRFLWIVRESGTHIVVPGHDGAIPTAEYLRDNEHGARAFWWDGKQLREVSWGQVNVLLTRVPA